MEAIEKAIELGLDREYISNWFGASNFFGTFYMSDMIDNQHFITGDEFMTSTIYALRKITSQGIETIETFATKQEALEMIGERK